MGLAGVKNKRKIGDDPNNTKWARNTDTFGHKLLRSKGWEPGQYLGKKDEAYAAFHTAASASYIRAVLREDNLGIGAKAAGNGTADECVGLDGFKDLLGRLNGQSEEVIEKQRSVRENIKMTLYVERRFGPMRFVRGGLLVGDTMKEENEEAAEAEPKAETTDDSDTTVASSASTSDEQTSRKKSEKKEKSKKRKATSDDDDAESGDSKKDSKSKRRRKDKSRSASDEDSDKAGEGEKKEKKKKKEEDKEERKKRKEEKKERKKERAERRKRKEEKREKKRRDAEAKSTPAATEAPANAIVAGPSSLTSSRHLSRRRYIAQKRAAVMDPQALKQIFMLKA